METSSRCTNWDKHVSEVQTHCYIVVLLPDNYPNFMPTNDQLHHLIEYIENAQLYMSEEQLMPIFDTHPSSKYGVIFIKCQNQYSLEWLKNLVTNMTPWECAPKFKVETALEFSTNYGTTLNACYFDNPFLDQSPHKSFGIHFKFYLIPYGFPVTMVTSKSLKEVKHQISQRLLQSSFKNVTCDLKYSTIFVTCADNFIEPWLMEFVTHLKSDSLTFSVVSEAHPVVHLLQIFWRQVSPSMHKKYVSHIAVVSKTFPTDNNVDKRKGNLVLRHITAQNKALNLQHKFVYLRQPKAALFLCEDMRTKDWIRKFVSNLKIHKMMFYTIEPSDFINWEYLSIEDILASCRNRSKQMYAQPTTKPAELDLPSTVASSSETSPCVYVNATSIFSWPSSTITLADIQNENLQTPLPNDDNSQTNNFTKTKLQNESLNFHVDTKQPCKPQRIKLKKCNLAIVPSGYPETVLSNQTVQEIYRQIALELPELPIIFKHETLFVTCKAASLQRSLYEFVSALRVDSTEYLIISAKHIAVLMKTMFSQHCNKKNVYQIAVLSVPYPTSSISRRECGMLVDSLNHDCQNYNLQMRFTHFRKDRGILIRCENELTRDWIKRYIANYKIFGKNYCTIDPCDMAMYKITQHLENDDYGCPLVNDDYEKVTHTTPHSHSPGGASFVGNSTVTKLKSESIQLDIPPSCFKPPKLEEILNDTESETDSSV